MKLILKTLDLDTNELNPGKTVEIPDDEIQNKTIKEIVAKYAFQELLEGYDATLVSQAVDMMFLLIQPYGIEDSDSWWEQEITSITINEKNTVEVALEFTELGKQFLIQQT